ncbi:hypothetical protein A7X84_16170 [Stenotrophomonas maltophilia]|nr:hypothetical protein A7X84_16170 [Stenotrophomonas maltophilia]PZT13468.1 hypothetical protein A7X82_02415 [Stenotrophomonas maltophilia]
MFCYELRKFRVIADSLGCDSRALTYQLFPDGSGRLSCQMQQFSFRIRQLFRVKINASPDKLPESITICHYPAFNLSDSHSQEELI